MTQQQHPSVFFDEAQAAAYDERFAPLSPLRAALDLILRAIFRELPEKTRLLCVGAGTGAELLAFAEAFPHWHFTAVEPSAPMLEICRQRAEAHGLTSRCTFHCGFIETLPPSEPFDAATSILVSHFILAREARARFFSNIAQRLCEGGLYINADLATDLSAPTSETLFETWLRMLRGAGISSADIAALRETYQRDVALLPPEAVEALIEQSGFTPPTRIFQAGLIHAWQTRKA